MKKLGVWEWLGNGRPMGRDCHMVSMFDSDDNLYYRYGRKEVWTKTQQKDKKREGKSQV